MMGRMFMMMTPMTIPSRIRPILFSLKIEKGSDFFGGSTA